MSHYRVALLVSLVLSCCWLIAGCGSDNGNGDNNNNGGDGQTTTISGQVVDASNPSDGIADAYVYVIPRAGMRQADRIETTADANGNYSLTGVAVGDYSLAIVPPEDSGFPPMEIPVEVGGLDPVAIRVCNVHETIAGMIAAVLVDPPQASLEPSGSQAFTSTVVDADGNDLSLATTWVVTGGIGTITSGGVFSAGTQARAGSVCAVAGGKIGMAAVTVGDASSNNPPQIMALNTTPPDGIATGQTVTISATATDPDGDALAYVWFASGSITVGSGASVSWTAPGVAGRYQVTCLVNDGRGGIASRTITIGVGQTNHAPIMAEISASPGTEVSLGAQVTLTAAALDADDEELTFVWLGDGGAKLATGAVLRVDMPFEPVTRTFTCIVTDPSGASDSRSVTVRTTASAAGGTGIRVAFASAAGSVFDVYVGYANGSGAPANISRSADTIDGAPALSADNTMVAWTRRELSGDWEIYVAPVDGSAAPVNISQDPTHMDTGPTIDAAGSKVAWVKGESGDREIYVAPTDGSVAPVNLSGTVGVDSRDPSISGDGRKVAWCEQTVLVAPADGSGNPSSVGYGGGGIVASASLSFDGSWVAWEYNGQILAAQAQTGTNVTVVNGAAQQGRAPSISDDGGMVAWVGVVSDEAEGAFVAPVSAPGDALQLSAWRIVEREANVSISPDGSLVAWSSAGTSGDAYNVVVGNADGSGSPVSITTDGVSGLGVLQGN